MTKEQRQRWIQSVYSKRFRRFIGIRFWRGIGVTASTATLVDFFIEFKDAR